MATDFFDRQDHARRQTIRLLVMFVLSVVVIILAIYLVVVVALGGRSPMPRFTRHVFRTSRSRLGPLRPHPLECPSVSVGYAGNDSRDRFGEPVQDLRAFGRRRVDRLDAGWPGHQSPNH